MDDPFQIVRVGFEGNQAILTLEAESTGYQVQRSFNLIEWQTVSGTPTGIRWVGDVPTESAAYWRLIK